MKSVQIDTKQFSLYLRQLSKIVSKQKTGLPISKTILFEENGGKLLLKATSFDLNLYIQTDIEWPKEFEISIPYKQLAKLFRTSRAKDAFVSVFAKEETKVKTKTVISNGISETQRYTEDGEQRLLVWGNRAGTFTVTDKFNYRADGDDKFDWQEQAPTHPLSQKKYTKAWSIKVRNDFDTTLAAAATEDPRPVLHGLTFRMAQNDIMAADGFELAQSSDLVLEEVYREGPENIYTIPTAAFKVFSPKASPVLTFTFFNKSDSHSVVEIASETERATLYSITITNQAPQYDKVVQNACNVNRGVVTNNVIITKNDLASLIGASDIASATQHPSIMFHDGENYAFDVETFGVATEVIVNLSFGLGGEIALNPHYLKKALAHLLNNNDSVEVDCFYKSAENPIAFKNCDRLFIVMSMHGQGQEANHFMNDKASKLLSRIKELEDFHANS